MCRQTDSGVGATMRTIECNKFNSVIGVSMLNETAIIAPGTSMSRYQPRELPWIFRLLQALIPGKSHKAAVPAP